VVQERTEIPAGVFNVISPRDKAGTGEALTGDPKRAWRIASQLKAGTVGGEEPAGEVDGDPLLALGGQAVHEQRQVEVAALGADL
jgi:acyl-CoA reductase-like NAD-dependent aldehyde dehydrogenase